LFFVDWEFVQFGLRAYDIGQMIGDLYERKHFKEVDGALWVIDAFIEGYGAISDEMVFQTAIYTGVHLITWVNRGPPLHMRPTWATHERVVDVIKLGMTFIVKGWERDKDWLENSVIADFFKVN
jgi:thiamine kinase-like enzyme